MNKNIIESLIPIAIKAIDTCILKGKNTGIPKEYKGYISSFGAGIIQAGLLPIICFYEREESGAARDRSLLVKAIYYILKNKDKTDSFEEVKNNEKLKDYLINYADKEEIKEDIINASIALKLALRTYSFIDSDKENKGE